MSRQSARKPLRLPVSEAKAYVERNQALVVDVVGADAYEHIPHAVRGARRMNPDTIEETFEQLPSERTILTYCTCDNDEISARVAYFLRKHGYEAYAIQGGLGAWREAGYPIEEKASSTHDIRTEWA